MCGINGIFAPHSAALRPDPGSDIGRVCALESTLHLHNQLLRDADCAGMAHSLEIRAPLVDTMMLRTLAPVLPVMTAGAGKHALATAPGTKLPDAVLAHAKTGFGVSTGAWLATRETKRIRSPNGVASRRWPHVVLDACGA